MNLSHFDKTGNFATHTPSLRRSDGVHIELMPDDRAPKMDHWTKREVPTGYDNQRVSLRVPVFKAKHEAEKLFIEELEKHPEYVYAVPPEMIDLKFNKFEVSWDW